MNCKIVGITKPEISGVDNLEEFIAYCARVSNPDNQNNKKTAPKLLKYLVENKHWSPFEMSTIQIEINTTRDIGRQILRHRSFSFQEFSQRYAVSTDYTRREARLQDHKNRQNSIENDDSILEKTWQEYQDKVADTCVAAYGWAINQGIAKEQARAVLPEGLTETKIYMSGSVRSWMHYLQERCNPATQKEHREIALEILSLLEDHLPSIQEYVKIEKPKQDIKNFKQDPLKYSFGQPLGEYNE